MSSGSRACKKNELDAESEQRDTSFIQRDDLDHDEVVDDATRKLEMRRVSAMPCKVTTAADPNGSSLWRPCSSERSQMETKKLNSSCSEKDHEDIIIESHRIRTPKTTDKLMKTTSRTEVMFPCCTTAWCSHRTHFRTQRKESQAAKVAMDR